jgi:CubicO group peptidase (beta-lactamase class C family)
MPITQEAIKRSNELKIDVDKLNYLDSMIDKWVRDGKRERIVTRINRRGVTILEGTYGDLGRDGKPLMMDTIYPVASNTKPVISVLLHILQEEGIVDLTDPVDRYLGEYLGKGREKIAIWHFLTHTSGVRDEDFGEFIREYLKEKFNIEMADEIPHEQWVEVMLMIRERMELPVLEDDDNTAYSVWKKLQTMMPPKREPRTEMSYCNFGYEICRRVITTVTGESIDSYANRKLFQPLGMVDSHFKLPKEKWDRVVGRSEKAVGYPWQISPENFVSESGAGGLKTTVPDILRFAEMILNDGMHDGIRIISRFSAREMKTNQNTSMKGQWDAWTMGLNYNGFKKDDAGNLRSFCALDHGGYGGSKFIIDPEQGLTYAIYSVEVEPNDFSIFGRFTNMLYCALTD